MPDTTGKKQKQKKKKILVSLSVMTLASLGSVGQVGAQTINCPQPLSYGNIVTCGVAGSVTVTPSGTRSMTGCLSSGGAPFSNGRCIVTQSFPFRPIQISVPASAVITNGTSSMAINNFNLITDAGGATVTRTAPLVNIPLGADMSVGASQPGGSYSGTVTITATLQ